jgi:hypothetical protein
MSEANTYHTNWLLEKELKEEYDSYTCEMTFHEYAEDRGTYKGWDIKVVRDSSLFEPYICFREVLQRN